MLCKVHAYNSDTEEWSALPECLTDYFTLAVVNNLVTAVGGKQPDKCTNILLSLVNEGGQKKWVEHVHPCRKNAYSLFAVETHWWWQEGR